MQYDFLKELDSIWRTLGVQNHVVQSLKKKKNSKQAVELAQKIYLELKTEMLPDLVDWYRTKESLKDQITETSVREDVLHRVNAELGKYGVPLLNHDLLL